MARQRDRHEPWRVGGLFSQTDVTAVIEETQLRGTLLAIDEVNAGGGLISVAGGFDVIRESRRAVTPDPYLVSH